MPPEDDDGAGDDRILAGLRARRGPLTAEEEGELAKDIELTRREIVEAVVHSRVAVGVLTTMAKEAVVGKLPAQDVLAAGVTLDAVREIPTASPTALRALLLEHGLSERALDRIALDLQQHAGEAPGGSSSQRTAATIAGARATLAHAKTAFVEANIGLLVTLASKKARFGVPLFDLIQEGSLGIMRAAETFDYRRGVRFTTYASWWIRHALNRALSTQGRTIRLPSQVLGIRSRLRQQERELSLELGREPTEDELAVAAGLPLEKVRDVRAAVSRALSLDAPVAGETGATLGDFVPDPTSGSAFDDAFTKDLGERLRELLQMLTPREQEVLKLRFGIDSPQPLTLAQVGERFSVTRERIRQIEAAALAKLRARTTRQDLDALLS